MLIAINSCFQEKAPTPIVNLLKVKDAKYNLKSTNMLSLPKVKSTKHGLRSFRYFAAKTWNALYVACTRVETVNHLQIVGFDRSQLLKPKEESVNVCDGHCEPADNTSCCRDQILSEED